MSNFKHKIVLTIFFVFILGIGCNKSVELTIINETRHFLTPKVGIGYSKEIASFEDLHFYKKDTLFYNNNIKKGKTIFIYGELPEGLKTRTISIKVDEDIIKTIPINLNESKPDDALSLTNAINGFDEFGKPNSFLTEEAKGFCSSVLGSLRIYKDDSLIYIISPQTLRHVFSQFNYGARTKTIESIFNRNYFSKLNISLPLVTNANLCFGSSEFAKFSWHIEGAGAFEWQPPQGKSIISLFNNLPRSELESITDLFLKDTTIKMKFFYRAFIIKKLKIESRQFRKILGEIDVSTPLYFGTKSAYQESDSITYRDELKDAITQFWNYDVTWLLKQAVKKRKLKEEKEIALANLSKKSPKIFALLRESKNVDTSIIKKKDIKILTSSILISNKIIDSLSSEKGFISVKMDSSVVPALKIEQEKLK
jgi:hypothetical protein